MEIKEGEKTIKPVKKIHTPRKFVIALALVSIIGFLSIVLESLFFYDIENYTDTLWLVILGLSLVLQTSLREIRSIRGNGLTSDGLGKITMVVIGTIAIVAGILSLPQINIQNVSFLAVKGIIGILAIIFIILQIWISKNSGM